MLDLKVTAKEIITLDRAVPNARVMGVFAGKVVGFDDTVANIPAVRELDLGESTVVPGFIDAHCHTTWWGLGLNAVQLQHARGLDELYEMLAERAAELADSPGAWLHGTGFNQKHHGGKFPDIRELDRITGDRPLYLRHTSGHAAITNSATLKLIGAYDPDFPNPVGGEIVRDADGVPTGLVTETAQSLLQRRLLPYSTTEIVSALDAATSKYAEKGITTFAEAGIGGGWIGHSPAEVLAYQTAAGSGKLHSRARLMPALDSLAELTANSADFAGAGSALGVGLGETSGFGTDLVSYGHVKVFMDGSLLGATAAVTEEYCGVEHTCGYLLDSPEEYRKRVKSAYRAGWPLALHAIGDAAIDLALELLGECQSEFGKHAVPNRIEHFGISRPDQVVQAAQLGLAVTPQAGFIGPLGDQFIDRVGPERADWLYRGKSLVDAGVILAGSSDLPVADNDILRGMQSAVDRLTETGRQVAPAEALTPLEALRSYTEWAAIACGIADSCGTLSRGKNADFVVLDESPLTAADITNITVQGTYVGGNASYVAAGTNITETIAERGQ